ncbi:TPA: hypothetical protein ACH3X3_002811 [Trebouxia sp. C0006]
MSARHALIVFPEQTAGSTSVRKAYKMEWWSNMICVVLGHAYASCTFLGILSATSFPSNSVGWEYVCSIPSLAR